MKLYDLGATVLIIALLIGAHMGAKKFSPTYRSAITSVKNTVSYDGLGFWGLEQRASNIDDPVFQPES